MLSILFEEYKLYGCPNCGCDSATSGYVSGGGVTTGTCRHCKLTFEVRGDNVIGIVKYNSYPENPSDPKSKFVMECACHIPHPRFGTPAWHWEPKDIRPDKGEYWSSRGVGYDLSGFVRTKAAGERILAMVREVLGKKECKSWLDYRPSEPTWIQFKFQPEEFDLSKLHSLSGGIITKEILKQCAIWQKEKVKQTKSLLDL